MNAQDEQIKYIAHLCAEVGVVSLASVSIPFFIDNAVPQLAYLGIAITILFWSLGYRALNLLRTTNGIWSQQYYMVLPNTFDYWFILCHPHSQPGHREEKQAPPQFVQAKVSNALGISKSNQIVYLYWVTHYELRSIKACPVVKLTAPKARWDWCTQSRITILKSVRVTPP